MNNNNKNKSLLTLAGVQKFVPSFLHMVVKFDNELGIQLSVLRTSLCTYMKAYAAVAAKHFYPNKVVMQFNIFLVYFLV